MTDEQTVETTPGETVEDTVSAEVTPEEEVAQVSEPLETVGVDPVPEENSTPDPKADVEPANEATELSDDEKL